MYVGVQCRGASGLIASKEWTSSVPFFPPGIHFIAPACLAVFTLSAPRRLCGWRSTRQHWPQALMKNGGFCFRPIWPVYPRSRWERPGIHYTNQWPPRRESIPDDKLSAKCTPLWRQCGEEEWGKRGGGCAKSKSIAFSLPPWFMRLFWLFSHRSMDNGKWGLFLVRSSLN